MENSENNQSSPTAQAPNSNPVLTQRNSIPDLPIPQQPKSNIALIISLIVVIIVLVIAGLYYFLPTKSTIDPGNKQNNANTAKNTPVASANFSSAQKNFGFNYLQVLNKAEPNKSIIISPFSIESALAMVYAGSEKETKQEIAKVMALVNPDSDKINTEIKNTLDSLNSSQGATVEIANSLWGAEKIDFSKSYISKLVENFSAEVKSVDFGDAKTKDLINNWVSQKTHNKIPKIVEETNESQILALINAVYFNGDWETQFESQATTDKDFTNSTGKVSEVKMMRANRSFDYFENSDLQMLTMPYKNPNISTAILLPKKETSSSFLSKLTETNWNKWNAGLTSKKGSLELPKFELKYDRNMLVDLIQMGMVKATTNADFNPMFKTPPSLPVAISQAIHKTFIRMDEKGTEAAAVTYIGVSLESIHEAPKEIPFEMIVNKPYIIALTDETTDSMLFLGIIQDPTK